VALLSVFYHHRLKCGGTIIPITILITAFFNLYTAGKSNKRKYKSNFFCHSFLWIIHGLGFSNYFKAILGGSAIKVIAFGRICCGN
jgi:hypothetical protein